MLDCLFTRLLVLARHLLDGFQGEIRMDGLGAVASQQGEVVRLAGGTGFDHQADAGAQTSGHQMLVHRRKGQQSRHSDLILVQRAVGNDQQAAAAHHRILGFGAKRGKACLDALLAPGKRIADVQLGRADLVFRVGGNAAQSRHIRIGEHRLRDFQTIRRVNLVDAEKVRLRSDERHQRHHQLLTDRVDRWIGNLGEQLTEVVVQRLVAVRQDSQWRIVAHRPGRLFAARRHRLENELDVFLRVAEGLLTVEQTGRALRRTGIRRRLEIVQLDVDARHPVLVGLLPRQRFLEFDVVDDAPLIHVDQEHLAGLQTPFFDDLFVRNRQYTRFRRHDHIIVIGHQIARRPQPVAVKRGADLTAVGKRHGGRTIPRLHHGGVVLVESPALAVHQGVRLPGFGNEHHHGVRQRIATHHQEFQRVVERRRVGLIGIDQRPDLVEIGAEQR